MRWDPVQMAESGLNSTASLPSWVTLSKSFLRGCFSSFANLAKQYQVRGLLLSFGEILKMKPRVGHVIKARVKGA